MKTKQELKEWFKKTQHVKPEMEKHAIKQLKVSEHLGEMLKADKELYERILDTPGFSYHFNQILQLAVLGYYQEKLS